MSLIHGKFKTAVLVLSLLWLVGCVQTKPTPGYARAGDYIILGLGGVERNAAGEGALKGTDLTITLTDANSVQHTLQARYVFKSYADYTSRMNTSSIDGFAFDVGLTNMVPFDGGWFAVVPLTFPGQYTSPLPLAVGQATVSITSPKLTNIANSIEGDLSAVPIEIIAGVSPHDNEYQRQFIGYDDGGTNFQVEPDDLSGISEVGGLYLEINYSDDSFFEAGLEPMVVPSEHNPFVQLNYNHVSNGDGTGKVTVTLMNPAGFKTLANATQNSSLLSNLALRLIYFPTGTTTLATEAKASFSVDLANSYYIGMDGSVIAGMSPLMTHFEDL